MVTVEPVMADCGEEGRDDGERQANQSLVFFLFFLKGRGGSCVNKFCNICVDHDL